MSPLDKETPRLFLEEYGPPARERLARTIAEAKAEDALAPVTVVVPTPYAGISLRRSLSTASGGLVNVRFMVLPRLAEYLGSPSLPEHVAPLSAIVELAAIRQVGGEMAGHGPLGDVAMHPRLHASLRSTFRDIAGLSAAGLSRLETFDPLRAQVVGWHRRVRQLLDGYYDRAELYRAATAAVEEGKAASVLKDLGFIVFHLISDFTPAETALVCALGRGGHCAAVLGLTGETEADAPVRMLASRLEPVLGAPQHDGERPRQQCSIDHMVVAPDAREEVRWVLRHIAHQAGQGRPFHRMAVLYRQRDPYAFLVQSQMRLGGIPIAGPDPTPLRDTPAGRLLLYLLEVIESDFARESVMRLVAEAPLRTGSNGGLASGDLARWEVISCDAGIVGGVAQWKERLARYDERLGRRIADMERLDEAGPARLRGLEEQRGSARGLGLFIQELVSALPPTEGSPWSAFGRWAGGLLKQFACKVHEWPQEHQASYERVMSALGELGALDGLSSGGTDIAGFRLMLNDALEAPSGRTGPTGSGVFVAPLAAAQAMEFDIVYVLGMAEGAFPPGLLEDPVLPDQVRKALADSESLPLREARRADERRLFLAALATGARRILSYPRADTASQRGQYPSPWFVSEASRLDGKQLTSADMDRLEARPWLSVLHSSQHALEYAATLSPADIHDYDMSSIARWWGGGRSLAQHFLMKESTPGYRALEMEKERSGSAFTAWDGRLSELAGVSRRMGLPQDRHFSPTLLERWAVCPFRCFLGDILGISVLEKPEEITTISPMERGGLVHRILERFVGAALERGELPGYGEPWGPSHQGLLMEIAEEEFARAEAAGVTGRRLLWEMAREEMRSDLVAFLELDSKWRAANGSRPLQVECGFGLDGPDSLGPVVLTPGGRGEVRMRGRIDRVDANESRSRVFVIDYKTGSAASFRDMDKDPLGNGRHLQLPVYAMALRNSVPTDAEIVALYWFVTSRGGFETKAVPLAKVEDQFHRAVGIIATGIESGLFPANPGPPDQPQSNCTYCDFGRICPANRDLLWERKCADPEMAPYIMLGEQSAGEADE